VPTALLVEDDQATLSALTELVKREGFSPITASTLREARARMSEGTADLLVVDLGLPDGSGLELLKDPSWSPKTEVVLITGQATVETAILALRSGVTDYLTKPIEVDRLKAVLSEVARSREAKEEIKALRGDPKKFGLLVGASRAMQEVYDLIARAAPTNATVLFVGESGTGKDLAAQTLHSLSRRRKGPFLAVNCSAISPSLIESELFGHVRGSFTGADHTHRGYFERAAAGTLFLDEISEMPIELQVKLLRVLETSTIYRIGGDKEFRSDVRIIAATNRDPATAVAEGRMRQDLFFRLSVFPIRIPPLRERGGDIELLAAEYLRRLNEEEKTEKTLSAGALSALRNHTWPGNVRELKNVIHRAFIIADSEIGPDCLPMQQPLVPQEDQGEQVSCRVGNALPDVERRLTLATLEHFQGDKKRTAEVLGVSLRTVYNHLELYRREAADSASRSDTRPRAALARRRAGAGALRAGARPPQRAQPHRALVAPRARPLDLRGGARQAHPHDRGRREAHGRPHRDHPLRRDLLRLASRRRLSGAPPDDRVTTDRRAFCIGRHLLHPPPHASARHTRFSRRIDDCLLDRIGGTFSCAGSLVTSDAARRCPLCSTGFGGSSTEGTTRRA